MTDREKETTAGAVARVLAERELVLGTVECGTGGTVARQLFEAEDGPAALSDSLSVETIEEVIDILGLPAPQFKTSGEFSAKAVRAAAREGKIFLDVDVCLAVCMMPLPATAAAVSETAYVAVDDGSNIVERSLQYEGPSERMASWLVENALAVVQQAINRQ